MRESAGNPYRGPLWIAQRRLLWQRTGPAPGANPSVNPRRQFGMAKLRGLEALIAAAAAATQRSMPTHYFRNRDTKAVD